MTVDRGAVPLLRVEELSIEFRTRSGIVRALDRVGFTLGRGETMALVGESGSGKSVTAYAVMGINDQAARVTGGSIVFGGLDILAAEPKVLDEVRGREVAIIFQNPRAALNPIRPIGRQIADVLLRHGNVTSAQAPDRAIEMLAKVRIPDPKRRARAYPFELSGGMCQGDDRARAGLRAGPDAADERPPGQPSRPGGDHGPACGLPRRTTWRRS